MCAINQSQKSAIGGASSTMLGSTSLAGGAASGPMFRTLIASNSPSTTSKTGTSGGPGAPATGGGGSGGGGGNSGGRSVMAF